MAPNKNVLGLLNSSMLFFLCPHVVDATETAERALGNTQLCLYAERLDTEIAMHTEHLINRLLRSI